MENDGEKRKFTIRGLCQNQSRLNANACFGNRNGKFYALQPDATRIPTRICENVDDFMRVYEYLLIVSANCEFGVTIALFSE